MNSYSDVKSPSGHEDLLPHNTPGLPRVHNDASHSKVSVVAAFFAGVLACLAALRAYCAFCGVNFMSSEPPPSVVTVYAEPWAGSSEVHQYPPTSPTNVFPSLFPTSVGYAGPTATGAEPAVVATAPSYPFQSSTPNLVPPSFNKHGNHTSSKFDVFRHWGNLSPWFSVEHGAYGLHSSPETPDTCRITGLHLLHRHGARYPTKFGKVHVCVCRVMVDGHSAQYGGTEDFATRLNQHAAEWNATGRLSFLNEW